VAGAGVVAGTDEVVGAEVVVVVSTMVVVGFWVVVWTAQVSAVLVYPALQTKSHTVLFVEFTDSWESAG
jgi:acetyl-CoA carboxylase carboxyltransferase component